MANFTVTNLNDSGPGSLRAAIEASNATPAGSANTISFSVGGTITLTSDLPSITRETAIVAGSTATGSAPTVGINCAGHAGLVFDAGSDGSQLVGLSVGNAHGNGITLNASNVTLNNDYVGVALNGSALGNTGDGIYVSASSSGNQIGYNPDATNVVSNVISGNGGNGISLHGSADNTIVSNRIGTSVDGTTAMGNGGNGIWVTQQSNRNTIGGAVTGVNADGEPNDPTNDKGQGGPNGTQVIVTPPLGNLVSGNGDNGILIDRHSNGNVMSGNFVGTDVTGNAALGNANDGIAIDGADRNRLIGCQVNDNPFVYYNVVGGNGANGLRITDADNTVVHANFFGIGANNMSVVGNTLDGILVNGSSANTTVGGVIPLGNVSAGNGQNGIEVADTASGFTTFNTFGGLLAFYGAAANGNDGLLITSTGGNQTVRTNVFSGNSNNGIEIAGDASGVTVAPNIVGLDTRGDSVLANGGNGLLITGTAHDNTIGALGTDQLSVIRQNTFSGNDGYGLVIAGQAYGNTVFATAIGTDIQETAAIGNGAGGILLVSTGGGNVIGVPNLFSTPSPSPSDLVNIISGNRGNGITVGTGAQHDTIVNNWIGLDIAGRPTLPNTGQPIEGTGSSNLIYGNGGVVVVGDGQVATGLNVFAPVTLEVYSGGRVNSTTIYAGGMEVVEAGAITSDTTVTRGATLQLLGDEPGAARLVGTTAIQNGGMLNAFGLGIGQGTLLTQGGGTTTAGSVVDNGEIRLKGGSFSASQLHVGTSAAGLFTQADGSVTVAGAITIAGGSRAAGSAYSLQQKTLTAGSLAVGTGGRFGQSNGSATVTGAITDDGSFALAAGRLDAGPLKIGVSALGRFTQNGGTAAISGALSIASGGDAAADSIYTMNGGLLTATALAVRTGGRFVQYGGSTAVSGKFTGDGQVSLRGGSFSAGSLQIGVTDEGRVAQVDGASTIGGALTIATGDDGADGSAYVMRGGTLDVGSVAIQDGGLFDQGGGTTKVSGNLTNNDTIKVTSGELTVDGDLRGTGNAALGAGTLHVDGGVASGQSMRFTSNAASLLELGNADRFAGTVVGFAADDAIDLQDFAFSRTSIIGVSGTGAAKTYTNVTLSDGTQTATFALYNQTANQYAVDAGAYTLKSDLDGATPGTLFGLAPGH